MKKTSKDYCWAIKVTDLCNNKNILNEAYWSFEKCQSAIKNRINYTDLKVVNDYMFMDNEKDLIYEIKLISILD